jgi:uncharacterized protein YegP (UPF0339 family)
VNRLLRHLRDIIAEPNPTDERVIVMFELYKDAGGEWRWRLVANNSKVIADCGEGYRRRHECVEAIERLKRMVDVASIAEIMFKPPDPIQTTEIGNG